MEQDDDGTAAGGGPSSEEVPVLSSAAAASDEDEGGPDEELVTWRLNPNTIMCLGRNSQLQKSRMNLCIGRYLAQPEGTMKNGCYV